MRSTSTKVVLVLACVVAAMALFVLLRDDDDGGETVTSEPVATSKSGTTEVPTPPPIPTIVVKGGEPVGGVAELDYRKGDRIRFVVRSDVDEEVHLHGYDVSKDVSAGGVARFDLDADIEGLFEVELEHSAVPIAEIKVAPG